MGNLKETHNVFLGFFSETHFVFPWEKPFVNHKMCLLMGFSRGNTTWRQQCSLGHKLLIWAISVWCSHLLQSCLV